MPPPAVPPSVVGDDRSVAVYQLKTHLVGINPQITRRVLVRGDTTVAELHHVFQVTTGWENQRSRYRWLLNPTAPHFLILSWARCTEA